MKKSTWITFGVFIIILAGFLILRNVDFDKDTKEDIIEATSTPVPSLRSFDDQDLSAILYEDSEDLTIKLEKVDTLEWTVSTHPEGQVTAGNVEEILSYLSDLELLSVVSSSPPLSDVGLDDPEQFLQLEYDDGTIYTIAIGMVTPLGDGYYTQVNDFENVVVLPINSIDLVITLLKDATLAPTPTPTLAPTENVEAALTPTPESSD